MKKSNDRTPDGTLNAPSAPEGSIISFKAARARQLAGKQKREQLRSMLLGKRERPSPPPPAA